MGFGALLWLGATPLDAAGLTGATPLSGRISVRSQADSLVRILALRVEFVADQVATTTGTGRFDYGTATTYALDRPPHGRTYFQHQLLALGTYFSRVSGDRVRVNADVFPAAESEAYQLAHDMVYYSGQEDDRLQQQRWAELLRDAVQLAAAGGGIDFSRYDGLIVFHAGVGQDFAFDFDSTPYDIQSVYMDPSSLAAGLGQDPATFKGIECPGGVYLRDGIILPESQNQESYDLGLLGTMTLLFGSKIGMPNLFDTESGRAGIGSWGLMDQGSYNFQGFIPAEPSAWEKIYMGWEEPIVIQSQTGVRLGSSRTLSALHIIKVPITSTEYFLIENRQRDPNHDRMTIGRDEAGKKAEFDSTGRVVAAAGIGVLTRVDEYDYGLPGSGILIWHIDEQVIQDNLASNTVNNNRDHRGVDLIECDGAQDIGYIYSLMDPGYGTENGDWWDPWWSGNESYLYVNESAEVIFSASSIPNSNAYGGAVSNIRIDGFSGLDTVMTLTISSGAIQPGFPLQAAAGRKLNVTSLAALAGATGEEGILAAATDEGQLLAWRTDGEKLFADGEYVVAWPLAAPATAPLFADLDCDGTVELYYPAASGDIYSYALREKVSAPGLLDLQGVFPLGDSLRMRIALTGGATPALILGNSRGQISVIRYDRESGLLKSTETIEGNGSPVFGLAVSPDGLIVTACDDGLISAWRLEPLTLLWQKTGLAAAQPLIADFDGIAGYELALIDSTGSFEGYSFDGALLGSYRPPLPLSGVGAPAIGDIDLDGLPEILCTAREGAAAFEFSGALVLNYPVSPGANAAGSPLFFEKRDGTQAWLAFAASDGLIHAFDQQGGQLAGFPLSGNVAAGAALLLDDFDGDGSLELAAAGRDGSLNLWDLGIERGEAIVWGQTGGVRRAFCLEGSATGTAAAPDLMPEAKVFCYPNPAVEGRTTLRFTLARQTDLVTVRIFDLAGNLVGELSRENLSPGDQEIVWDVSRIGSGVYLAKVTAQAGSETRFKVVKIAVTK
jgi:M6 family metalloprotease-like protein